MQWLKGDIISAFADVPDMRIRAEHYTQLAKNRDSWLQHLHHYACSSDSDFDAFRHISRRVGSCASQIIWGAGIDGKPERLIWGNFCENQWCPICARKKSVRLGRLLNEMMEKLSLDGYRFLHLVLSDRNCSIDNLGETLKHYNVSWNRFCNSTIFAKDKNGNKRFDGYFLSCEYTLSWNVDHVELHPHFHVILAAHPDRWSDGFTFITQADLVKKWRRSLKIDKRFPSDQRYDPRVWIKYVYPGDKDFFLEITKYVFDFGNFGSFIKEHPNTVSFGTLYQALKQKNLHRGGGVLAFSSKNLYFVQLTQSSPDYTPSYCIITGRSRTTMQYNLKFAVKLDDSVPIQLDGDIAPVKSFLKTYIMHQAYFYGFGYKTGDQIHLPEWWEDLATYSSARLINSCRDPSKVSISYDQLSIFDFL